jgi:hypothetical protein
MARHVVTHGPVVHDGALYLDGAELTLSDDAAAALVALGIIEAMAAAQKAKLEPKG